MSQRVLDFIERTLAPDFFGEVRIRARAGEVVKVAVERDYILATLPTLPDTQTPTTNTDGGDTAVAKY